MWCCGGVVCMLCRLCCGGVVCMFWCDVVVVLCVLCRLCCGGVVCMLWCDVVTLLPHSCPHWAGCCAGLRWEEVRLRTSVPPSSSSDLPHPSQPRHPANFLYLHQHRQQQHMCWPESAAWVQLKAVLCLQSPIRWPGGHRAGVLCKQASWHVNYLIKLCQWFIGDPNLPMSYPWHKKMMFSVTSDCDLGDISISTIYTSCLYWRYPGTGQCPVQNMFLMWHILLFSYNCPAACPQCPAILHRSAIVTLCRGY